MGQFYYNEIYTAVSALFCVLCTYQLWVQSRMRTAVGLLQHAMPRFTLAGAIPFLISYVITIVYERSYSNALAFASDISFYVGTIVDFAHVFYIIFLSVKNSRHLASMTPDPAIVLRDRIFFICLWLVLLVTTISAQTLMYVRNEASYLGVFYAVAAPVVMGALGYMWYSIYQLTAYMDKQSARFSSGVSNASLATFTKTMYFMTACFAVLSILLAYGAFKYLSSFGTTPYLPVPIPLDFSPFGSVYLVLWASAIWYSWHSSSGEADALRLSASSHHSAHAAARLAKANAAAMASTCDTERDTVAMTTESRENRADLSAMNVAVQVGGGAPYS
jgi:hypothetical protein